MPHILIIEDEPAMRLGLQDNLEFEGYEVSQAADGELGLQKGLSGKFDLIILDLMLPKMSGFDVCKSLRKAGIQSPIILLTAKGEEIDKVLGLELGADDYMTKPFSLRELLARIKAILRRTGHVPSQAEDPIVQIGQLSLDFVQYKATSPQGEEKLSHKEFEILKFLWEQRNEVVSRSDLLEKVWGYDAEPTTRTVDNFIARLRQKVEKSAKRPEIILTVHGIGYKLVV
jgi:DNA-binding response OmpR family regulator